MQLGGRLDVTGRPVTPESPSLHRPGQDRICHRGGSLKGKQPEAMAGTEFTQACCEMTMHGHVWCDCIFTIKLPDIIDTGNVPIPGGTIVLLSRYIAHYYTKHTH